MDGRKKKKIILKKNIIFFLFFCSLIFFSQILIQLIKNFYYNLFSFFLFSLPEGESNSQNKKVLKF